MRRNGQLTDALHVLLHLAEQDGPATSATLAKGLDTHPVVIRRLLGRLQKHGYVQSGKGHGGGSSLACGLAEVTVRDIYDALGSPALLALGNRVEASHCLIEQTVNAALDQACQEAEQVLLTRFGDVSLARLRADLDRRIAERGCAHRSAMGAAQPECQVARSARPLSSKNSIGEL